jgi:hypothetical protein
MIMADSGTQNLRATRQPCAAGQAAARRLVGVGVTASWRGVSLSHSVRAEAIGNNACEFIGRSLPNVAHTLSRLIIPHRNYRSGLYARHRIRRELSKGTAKGTTKRRFLGRKRRPMAPQSTLRSSFQSAKYMICHISRRFIYTWSA